MTDTQAPPTTPQIIAVGGLKGGIGKTTLSMFAALVFASIHSKRVLLVDADPASQSAYDWWRLADKRGDRLPFDIETWPHGRVGEMVMDRTPGRYDVVVIDCGGDSDAILSSAVAVCHYALLATTANMADLRRVAPTFEAAAKAARDAGRAEEITASVVMLRVDNRRQGKNQDRRDQLAARLPVLDAQTSLRPSIYDEAFSKGAPEPGDLEEVQAILKEIGAVA